MFCAILDELMMTHPVLNCFSCYGLNVGGVDLHGKGFKIPHRFYEYKFYDMFLMKVQGARMLANIIHIHVH